MATEGKRRVEIRNSEHKAAIAANPVPSGTWWRERPVRRANNGRPRVHVQRDQRLLVQVRLRLVVPVGLEVQQPDLPAAVAGPQVPAERVAVATVQQDLLPADEARLRDAPRRRRRQVDSVPQRPPILAPALEDDLSLEKYFAAKSLLSSRSFRIDKYHGSGMVPLADLFNHKTDGEHVHFTKSEASDSDEEEDGDSDEEEGDNDQSNVDLVEEEDDDDQSNDSADEPSSVENPTANSSGEGYNGEDLEMIIVRDANPGDEVYNTYGTMGNAALLHRYGFTELDNPYDIVNIDLTLVTKWCSSKYSHRYAKARVSLWHKLGYSGCTSEDAEYFEISYDGEPQLELLILLYIVFLEPEVYDKLVCTAEDLIGDDEQDDEQDTIDSFAKVVKVTRPIKNGVEKLPDVKKLLHSESIGSALASIADIRESLYGSRTLKDDEEKLQTCSPVGERNLYHSLVLRVSERKILGRLRKHASSWSKAKKRKHT